MSNRTPNQRPLTASLADWLTTLRWRVRSPDKPRRPAIALDELLGEQLRVLDHLQVAVDTLSPEVHDQQVLSYESSFRQAIAQGGSIYGANVMLPIIHAAHERRIQLLDSLPIGDVSDKVCVDYGVGSWGFACIYPRLQHCAFAIGIDISYEAIKESAAVSARGNFPYGSNYVYLTSRGDNIKLKDHCADIFFTGECIEHVENTSAFLDEIHRILKPAGLLILTTPNADAYLHRLSGEQYAVGPEHVALMSYTQLRSYLDSRFEVLTAQGFNGSLHYSWDERIDDLDFARAWASQCTDRPDLGTGVVIMARRRDDYHPARYIQRHYHHDAPEISYEGLWETVPLHKAMTGRMGIDGDRSALMLDFEGNGIIINFWCHTWSGQAFVEVDGVARYLSLYSSQGGFTRVVVDDLAPGSHRLRIYGSQARDWCSHSNQVIFFQAISYQRQEAAIVTHLSAEGAPMEIRPGRFGAIYTAPVLMTWSERVVLYSTIFGLRPRRCLEIGTHKGGSSLIISAALDDIGAGYLVCVDPTPMVAPQHWQQLSHHATLLASASPEVLPQAVQAAGGRFDFALIDGDHELLGVIKDIEGVLPLLEDNAHLVLHDAHYYQVANAIDQMLQKYSDCLIDCGMISTEQTLEENAVDGHPVIWGGLRMLRYRRAAQQQDQPTVEKQATA
jgi:SAM-dependent methyltransferase/predicted O-methyltransferase YrrM